MNQFAQKFPASEYYFSFYTYTLSVATIANGVTTSASVNIESDSIFIWTKATYFSDLAGAVQTDSSRVIPLITLQITDTGSGRIFFDIPQPLNSIGGHDGLPAILPAPYMFKKNSTIQGSFSNFSAASTYLNTTFSMQGYRVYKY